MGTTTNWVVVLAPKQSPPRVFLGRFNIDEMLDMEKMDRGVPTIVVNGNLDRVRSGYYPRHVLT